jgi:predicted MFS family arabinose efflux permease
MTVPLVERAAATRATLFLAGGLGYVVPMVLPIMLPNIARDIGVDIGSVGVLVGMQSVVVAVTSILIGPLSDRFGAGRLVPLLLLINGVTLLAFSQSQSMLALYLSGMLTAMAFGPLAFCALAYIGDCIEENARPSFIGLVSGSLYACVVVSFPVTVLIMDRLHLGWRAALVPFGILSIACGLLAFGALKRPVLSPAGNAQAATIAGILRTYFRFLRVPAFAGFLAIFFIIRLGVGIYLTYCATYLLTARDFPSDGFMWINAAGGVLAFFTSLYSGKLVGFVGQRQAIAIASTSLIISIFLIIYYPTSRANIVLWIGLFSAIYMVSEAIRMSSLYMIAVAKVDAGIRGAFLGCINFLIHLGTAAGALLGGALLANAVPELDKSITVGEAFPLMVQITAVLWLLAAFFSAVFASQGDSVTPAKEVSV